MNIEESANKKRKTINIYVHQKKIPVYIIRINLKMYIYNFRAALNHLNQEKLNQQ